MLLCAGVACVLGVSLHPEPSLAQKAKPDSAAIYDQQLQEQEKQLQQLREQIGELRRQDRELGQEEVGKLEQLRILDKEVTLTTELLHKLEEKQTRLSTQLEGIRTEYEFAQEVAVERKARLGKTLRSMYIRGSANAAEVLLRTTSLRDALTRFKYLGLLARNNESLLAEIRQQEASLATATALLTENLAAVNATTYETQNEKRNLEDSRQVRKSTLQRVRNKRSEQKKMLEALAASEKKVQALIAVLEERRERALASGMQEFPDVGFAKLRGRMSWPVRGTLMTMFGPQRHPVYGTVTMNSGVDIAAESGTAVRSVARGRVEYVAWLDGYGRTVIVNHGGGYYTVYAHLSQARVSEAQEVAPGQVIGDVGDTGSLEGPKLHFEIRYKAEAVDPQRWLAS